MDNGKLFLLSALVVDDNEINLLMLVSILKQYEVKTDTAFNGLDALNFCRKKEYDFIFIDHFMPDMDGLQTTETIRKVLPIGSKTVIIILSAEITEELKNMYRAAGADDIFVKPLRQENVEDILIRYNKKAWESFKREEVEGTSKRDLLEASLTDLQTGISQIFMGIENKSTYQQHMGTHKLMNVFISLKETGLINRTKMFDQLITEGNAERINKHYAEYMKEVIDFINIIYIYVQNSDPSNTEEGTDNYILMSNMEYEQSLINAIYYIRRFEYDYIVRELQHLIRSGQSDFRHELETALQEMKQYQYEKALLRIINIQKKTGKLPVPDIIKQAKLEYFWD